ncbi:MAG TPA: polysaccharide biosynthesis/export family protein [Vicinamibacteria bacterium]|jgi:polysaccharide export outer membrane protein
MVQILIWAAAILVIPSTMAAAQEPAAAPAPSTDDVVMPDYYVAPGDMLRIAVWKEPEVSADVMVRLDGRITVPLVGDMRAAGRTPEQLTNEVRTRLRAFLEVPVVTITVAQANSARFFLFGEVARAGLYPLTSRMTVLQALAMAGGFREFAKRDQVLILRERAGTRTVLRVNFRELVQGLNLEQNVVLESGDTVIVP